MGWFSDVIDMFTLSPQKIPVGGRSIAKRYRTGTKNFRFDWESPEDRDLPEVSGDPGRDRGRRRERETGSTRDISAIKRADEENRQNRERTQVRESAILNENFSSIVEGLKDQYSLRERELKTQIDQLIDINLSYQRPAIIQTLFQKKQAQSYLPTSIRTDRGAVGGL